MLIGKKMIVLFLLLLVIFHFYYFSNYKKLITGSIFIFIALSVFFKETIVSLILKIFPFWKSIYYNHGILNTLTSFRSNLFKEAMEYINRNWNLWNYMFGSIDFRKYKTEFEFVDFFILMGFTGILFYLYIVYAHFMKKKIIWLNY
jgi:NADH:ubiquinone oxidoreductase subunit K